MENYENGSEKLKMFRFDFNNAGIIHAHLGNNWGERRGRLINFDVEKWLLVRFQLSFTSRPTTPTKHHVCPLERISIKLTHVFVFSRFFCLWQTLVVKPSVRTFDLDDGKLSCIIKSLEMARQTASFLLWPDLGTHGDGSWKQIYFIVVQLKKTLKRGKRQP